MSKNTKGLSQLIKRVFLKYVTGYRNEQKYWDSRWKLGLKDDEWTEDNRQKMIKLLENLMAKNQCKTFLDVGCGKAVLRDLPGYVGLDFSLESIKRSGLKEAVFADITNRIPLPDKSFDAVFTRTVLLHIPPDKIERAVSEVCRVTKKCLILHEPHYDPNGPELRFHCFNHNLPEIVGRHFKGETIFL
jgi:SAM-dependent methyltransferase